MDQKETLRKNSYCNIATVCDDGSPWNTPVFYANDSKIIYWWSGESAVHSRNIARDPRVFITVYDSTVAEGKGEGLYIKASARRLDGDDADRAASVYNNKAKTFQLKKSDYDEQAPTKLYQADIEQMWRNVDGEVDGYFVDAREEVTV